MQFFLIIIRLTFWQLPHGDYDHIGSAINLTNNINIDNVIFNCGELNDLENDLINNLNKKKY